MSSLHITVPVLWSGCEGGRSASEVFRLRDETYAMPSESTVSVACLQSPTIRSAAPSSTPCESRLKHKSSRSERARPADNAMDGLKGARRGMAFSQSPAPLLHPARHSCTPSSSAGDIASTVKACDGLYSGKITLDQDCDTCIRHAGSTKVGAAHAELSCWHPGHCYPAVVSP